MIIKIREVYESFRRTQDHPSSSGGTNPFTGGGYSASSPVQQPDMVRALYKAVEELENRVKYEEKMKNRPERSGKPWTDQEDEKLLEGYDSGMQLEALAERHKRTLWAVQQRMVSLGKLKIHYERVNNPTK